MQIGNLLLQIYKAIVFLETLAHLISESMAIFLALVQVKDNHVKHSRVFSPKLESL